MRIKMKGMLASLMGLFASTEVAERRTTNYRERKKISPKEMAQRQEKLKLEKGLKKFSYGENYIIALNQKNADRKARQQGFIQ